MARYRSSLFSITALALAAIGGCSAGEDTDGTASDVTSRTERTLAIDEDVSVLVEHPETLQALEGHGFDLGSRLSGGSFKDNQAFAASPEGGAIISVIEQAVSAAKAKDKGAHPLFDTKW